MYSFPNYIPVSAAKVRQVAAAIERYEFCRVYGQWWDAVIPIDGKDVIRRSAERYLAAVDAGPLASKLRGESDGEICSHEDR
jgi:hypothetical protein